MQPFLMKYLHWEANVCDNFSPQSSGCTIVPPFTCMTYLTQTLIYTGHLHIVKANASGSEKREAVCIKNYAVNTQF